mmetsp:Transcript_50254/g.98960  ORF Transcript_50254/g.98960 Transcript_50254/m.98960 type:complete len:104 (+) Transcript_50254:264-575(+)
MPCWIEPGQPDGSRLSTILIFSACQLEVRSKERNSYRKRNTAVNAMCIHRPKGFMIIRHQSDRVRGKEKEGVKERTTPKDRKTLSGVEVRRRKRRLEKERNLT